jgi:hypothetical protein
MLVFASSCVRTPGTAHLIGPKLEITLSFRANRSSVRLPYEKEHMKPTRRPLLSCSPLAGAALFAFDWSDRPSERLRL